MKKTTTPLLSVALAGAMALAAATLTLSSVQAASIVLNGSFETGDYTNWTPSPLTGVESSRGEISGAQDGSSFAIGNDQGGFHVYQTIPTVTGTTYDLSFYLARPQTTTTTFHFNMDVFDGINGTDGTGDGDLLDANILNGDVAGFPSDGWQQFTFQFTAASTQATLRFGDSGTINVDPAVDNISVEAVPEPGTLTLFGLAGLTVLFRRRR
jgi:hypothetical protein